MKKIISLGWTSTYLLLISTAYAQAPSPDTGKIIISRPQLDNKNVGFGTLGDFVQKTLAISFIIAVLAVLFMLIWGAFEWITSGGDKEAVGKARNRIINALIGLAVLAIAFALFQVASSFLGFNILNVTIPTPSQ